MDAETTKNKNDKSKSRIDDLNKLKPKHIKRQNTLQLEINMERLGTKSLSSMQ